jgi:hypothetical protein
MISRKEEEEKKRIVIENPTSKLINLSLKPKV